MRTGPPLGQPCQVQLLVENWPGSRFSSSSGLSCSQVQGPLLVAASNFDGKGCSNGAVGVRASLPLAFDIERDTFRATTGPLLGQPCMAQQLVEHCFGLRFSGSLLSSSGFSSMQARGPMIVAASNFDGTFCSNGASGFRQSLLLQRFLRFPKVLLAWDIICSGRTTILSGFELYMHLAKPR